MMETDTLDWGAANGTKHLHSDVKSYGLFAAMANSKKEADKLRKDFEVSQKKMRLKQQRAMIEKKNKENQGIIMKLLESNDHSEERVVKIMNFVRDTDNTTDSALEETESFLKRAAAKNLDAISENMKRKRRVIDRYLRNLTISPININTENTSTEQEDLQSQDETLSEELSCSANYHMGYYNKPLNVPAEPVLASRQFVSTSQESPLPHNETQTRQQMADSHQEPVDSRPSNDNESRTHVSSRNESALPHNEKQTASRGHNNTTSDPQQFAANSGIGLIDSKKNNIPITGKSMCVPSRSPVQNPEHQRLCPPKNSERRPLIARQAVAIQACTDDSKNTNNPMLGKSVSGLSRTPVTNAEDRDLCRPKTSGSRPVTLRRVVTLPAFRGDTKKCNNPMPGQAVSVQRRSTVTSPKHQRVCPPKPNERRPAISSRAVSIAACRGDSKSFNTHIPGKSVCFQSRSTVTYHEHHRLSHIKASEIRPAIQRRVVPIPACENDSKSRITQKDHRLASPVAQPDNQPVSGLSSNVKSRCTKDLLKYLNEMVNSDIMQRHTMTKTIDLEEFLMELHKTDKMLKEKTTESAKKSGLHVRDPEEIMSDKLPALEVVQFTKEMLTLALTVFSICNLTSLDIFPDTIRMFLHFPILKELYMFYLEHKKGNDKSHENGSDEL